MQNARSMQDECPDIHQVHWRARSARRLARQHRAARVIQSCWRGTLVRRAAAAQEEAAVRIQTCWRRARAQAAYQQSRACIILVRASHHPADAGCWGLLGSNPTRLRHPCLVLGVRELAGSTQHLDALSIMHCLASSMMEGQGNDSAGHTAEQGRCAQVQAQARMLAARRGLQQARTAATLIQSHWRRARAMRLREQITAAIVIQRSAATGTRGLLHPANILAQPFQIGCICI